MKKVFVSALTLLFIFPLSKIYASESDLLRAIELGDLAQVKSLIEDKKIVSLNSYIDEHRCFSPIYYAVKYNQTTVFDYLLSEGANILESVNLSDSGSKKCNGNILRIAAVNFDTKTLSKIWNAGDWLLKKDIVFDAITSRDVSLRNFKLLVDSGIDLNLISEDSKTILGEILLLRYDSQKEIILEKTKFLIARGFDLELSVVNNLSSELMLFVSNFEGSHSAEEKFFLFNIVDVLLESLTELERVDYINYTPSRDSLFKLNALNISVANNQLDLVKKMVEYGADINNKNLPSEAYSALETAVKILNRDTVEFLLEKGADIDRKRKSRFTSGTTHVLFDLLSLNFSSDIVEFEDGQVQDEIVKFYEKIDKEVPALNYKFIDAMRYVLFEEIKAEILNDFIFYGLRLENQYSEYNKSVLTHYIEMIDSLTPMYEILSSYQGGILIYKSSMPITYSNYLGRDHEFTIQGVTPLMMAADLGPYSEVRLELVRDLISKGADVSAKDSFGFKAFDYANYVTEPKGLLSGRREAVLKKQDVEVLKLLAE